MGTSDSFSLKGKVIIVTGGTGILGSSFVQAIVAANGTVVILNRNEQLGAERAAVINAAGGKALAVKADVLKEAELVTAREKVLATFGRIDGLVNAAGGNVPNGVVQPDADVFSLNMEGMRQAMELNLWGSVIPVQVFGKAMANQSNGSIVNISSVSSKRVLTRVLGYSMGKAAVDIYTQWLAVEVANRYGDAIRVNAIMPGFFLTDQNRALLTNADGSHTPRAQAIIANTPFKRFGNPEELNGALIYLLSDASRFVTGTQINVDGGFTVFSGV